MSDKHDYESYILIKTIIYLVAGFLALFISTCSAGCGLNSLATESHQYGNFAWALIFGIVALVTLNGFGRSRDIIEKHLRGEAGIKEEEKKEEKKDEPAKE